MQAQIDWKEAKQNEEQRQEQQQDAVARRRGAEREAMMKAHLLQAQPVATRHFGYKKSQFM